jgi:sugar/nucleoside kinase (ribokinase family)
LRGALVLGDLCLDVDVEQGEMRGGQVEARSIRLCPAGSGGNFAITLSTTGLDSVMASPVSGDSVLGLLRGMLSRLGVGLEEIRGEGGTCTIVNIYRAGKPKRVYYHAGPRARIGGLASRLSSIAERLGHMHVTGYLLELVPASDVEALVAGRRGYTVSVDLHPRAGLAGPMLSPILARADYVMGTASELRALGPGVSRVAADLIGKGVRCVVAKLGSLGARAYCREGVYRARPPRVRPVILKGAGDVLAAYFIWGVAMGMGHGDSLERAVHASAEHVAGRGPLNRAWAEASSLAPAPPKSPGP